MFIDIDMFITSTTENQGVADCWFYQSAEYYSGMVIMQLLWDADLVTLRVTPSVPREKTGFMDE